MTILSKYVYSKYLTNVKKGALHHKRINRLDDPYITQDGLESWIYYKAMSDALHNLETYLMDNHPNTLLEYLLERQEKDCLRYANLHPQYIINDNRALHIICYNAELLYELDNFELTLTKQQTIYILTKVLNIALSYHEIGDLLSY